MIPKVGDKVKIRQRAFAENPEFVFFHLEPTFVFTVIYVGQAAIENHLIVDCEFFSPSGGRKLEHAFVIQETTGNQIILDLLNGTATVGSLLFEPADSSERGLTAQELKQLNSMPSATCCAKCGRPLKQVGINIKFCPKCEP